MDENGFAGPGTLRISRPIQTGLKTTTWEQAQTLPSQTSEASARSAALATDSSIHHGGGRCSRWCCSRRVPADVRRLCLLSPACPGRPPCGGALQQPLRLRQLLLSTFPLLFFRCKIRFIVFLPLCSGSEACADINYLSSDVWKIYYLLY
jgi:hypothetical protein